MLNFSLDFGGQQLGIKQCLNAKIWPLMDNEYFVVPASFGIVPGGEIIGVQEANAIFWRHLKFIHMLHKKKDKLCPHTSLFLSRVNAFLRSH